MIKQSQFSSLAAGLCLVVSAFQVSCSKTGASASGGSTYAAGSDSKSDYPFDANGNYRPEFLAANGGGAPVVDLTTDNPKSVFTSTASNDGWSAGSSKPSSSGGSSKPKVTSKPTASVSKPKPKPVAAVSKPKPKPAPAATTSHTVGKGDTLFSLSKRYGTTVAAIQAANGMGSSTNLREGKPLKIPQK